MSESLAAHEEVACVIGARRFDSRPREGQVFRAAKGERGFDALVA
ncbi:hypothetical protein [Cellulomonas sp. NTE-D12]|nr:hypothetical protein CELD12_06050 [Cellulomonas sp. NTE-D12]